MTTLQYVLFDTCYTIQYQLNNVIIWWENNLYEFITEQARPAILPALTKEHWNRFYKRWINTEQHPYKLNFIVDSIS